MAHAQWVLPARTIDNVYMTSDGGSVYATFDSAIGFSECPGAKIIQILAAEARFEEMYASVLRAQAAQTGIQVFDNFTDSDCNPSGTVVRLPYLRFLSQ